MAPIDPQQRWQRTRGKKARTALLGLMGLCAAGALVAVTHPANALTSKETPESSYWKRHLVLRVRQSVRRLRDAPSEPGVPGLRRAERL